MHGCWFATQHGKLLGSKKLSEMTTTCINSVYQNVMECSTKKTEVDRKRRATDEAKSKRRQSKYSRKDDSIKALKAYSRHNDGVLPDEVEDDISPEHLADLTDLYYKSNVVVTIQEAMDIEIKTRGQGENDLWKEERRKRLTSSIVGGIIKMQKRTKCSKKVQTLLYSTFKGNDATRYGLQMEDEARHRYKTYQQQKGHSGLEIYQTGLVICKDNPWLAASPDDKVKDPSTSDIFGLVEYKNPYSVRDKSIDEACRCKHFCLQKKENNDEIQYTLKKRHDYYYQVQCQMYCNEREWCDFVLCTENDIHVERIYRNTKWWDEQLYETEALSKTSWQTHKHLFHL